VPKSEKNRAKGTHEQWGAKANSVYALNAQKNSARGEGALLKREGIGGENQRGTSPKRSLGKLSGRS